MIEEQVEESIYRLKNTIQVNQELKQKLRALFNRRRKRSVLARWGLLGTAAAVLFAASWIWEIPGLGVQQVNAAALKVHKQASVVDIAAGSPVGVAVHEDKIYVPIAGKGLFVSDDKGFRQLWDQEVNEVSVSPDGKRLAWAANGKIGIFDVGNGVSTEILKDATGGSVYFEQPSWTANDSFLYVKKIIELSDERGVEVKESSIYEWKEHVGEGENASASFKQADGSFPMQVKGQNAIVFQKETDSGAQIIYKDLAKGQERVIDEGRFPSVSPDGRYVAYVKTEHAKRELKPGAFVEESLDNVWISDTDGGSKQAVTSNPVFRFTSEQDWLKTITPSDTPQVLTYTGLFSYYNPAWSSDSGSLYALKNRNAEGGAMSLMRIDLSGKTLKAEETVRAFEQAVIQRDHDFARSLLKNKPEEFVIMSNPHKVGYTILGSGEENGREYVDVEEYGAYTAQPFASVSRVRYFLVNTDKGYLIDLDRIKAVGEGGITVGENAKGAIVRDSESGKETLFTKADIPRELLPAGNFRISAMAYLEQQKSLLFTLQALQDKGKGQQASVKLIRYDSNTKTFTLLENITELKGVRDVGVESVIVSPDGRYAALDLYSDDPAATTQVLIFALEKKSSTLLDGKAASADVTAGMHTFYWDQDELHLTVRAFDQTLHYKWNAGKGKVERP